MSHFNTNFTNLAKQVLFTVTRGEFLKTWVSVLVSPVVLLQTLFNAFRGKNIYLLKHNGQVCYLESALNDAFDSVDRRIYINDPYRDLVVWLGSEGEIGTSVPFDVPTWTASEGEVGATLYPSPIWLYTEGETLFSDYDFYIWIPATVTYNANQLTALVNSYKLPGRTWTIQTY
jgi:hypothetical protein